MSGLRHFRFGDWDKQVTKLLRTNGIFEDRRSKVVHNLEGELHLLLFGRDMEAQRRRVFDKKKAPFHWELHHIESGNSGRCDCQSNLRLVSPEEHRKIHNREVKL